MSNYNIGGGAGAVGLAPPPPPPMAVAIRLHLAVFPTFRVNSLKRAKQGLKSRLLYRIDTY